MRSTLGSLVCALAALSVWGARASLLPLAAERLRAAVGGFAVMNCHLDFPFGNEIPYYLQWDKDGDMVLAWLSGWDEPRVGERWGGRARRVGGSGPGDTLGEGSLNVSSVRETDAGLYRCRVSFPNRSPPTRNNGTYYYLDVDGGTVIATPPVNVTVREGERAELECGTKDIDAVVQWMRDGEPLATVPELAARADLPSNGSLVLRAAAASDAGFYECHASHDSRKQSANAYLDVQYAAKVVYAPSERHLALGAPASLDCHFSANPPLTNLRWEKDGFLFDPYNVPGVFYSRNGSLLFNRVDESHEGLYSCTAYNALGSAGPSPAVRVRVQRPPALAARPQPLYVARLGEPLALPCVATVTADDDALLDITWSRKDGADLPADRYSVTGGNLSITAVAAEDRGVLVCTLRNAAATTSVETELRVENLPPRAPHRLVARPAATSLQLTWTPGHAGDRADTAVWYRVRAAAEWRTLRLPRGAALATLRGLRPATEYELRVLTQDALGDGLFSQSLFVTTLDEEFQGSEAAAVTEGPVTEPEPSAAEREEARAALPVSVRLLDDGALVRWERAPTPGDTQEARCTLRWYREEDGARLMLATAHTHHGHMLVHSVEEGARYWADVRCGGAAGGAGVVVPQYARLRGVAGGVAGAALLLALLAGALYMARRRLPPCRSSARQPPAPRSAPPPPPKRRY